MVKSSSLAFFVLILIFVVVLTASQPANVLGVPNTVNTADINVSASGNTLLISHSGTLSTYITHYHVFASGTTSVSLVYGTQTTTACDTGTTTIEGPLALSASTGVAIGTGLGAVIAIPSGKDVCVDNSNAIQVGGAISSEYSN